MSTSGQRHVGDAPTRGASLGDSLPCHSRPDNVSSDSPWMISKGTDVVGTSIEFSRITAPLHSPGLQREGRKHAALRRRDIGQQQAPQIRRWGNGSRPFDLQLRRKARCDVGRKQHYTLRSPMVPRSALLLNQPNRAYNCRRLEKLPDETAVAGPLGRKDPCKTQNPPCISAAAGFENS